MDKHYVSATCNDYDEHADNWWSYLESKIRKYSGHESSMCEFITYYLMGTPQNLDILYHCVVTNRGNHARLCFPIGYWSDNIAQRVRNFKIDISYGNGWHIADLKTSSVVNVYPEVDPDCLLRMIHGWKCYEPEIILRMIMMENWLSNISKTLR